MPEAFVHITLPGAVEPITAGRFVMETDRTGTSVGRFVYGRRYLAHPEAVEIDPVELKLAPRTYETAALGGVFGALRDASPDYWGRRVIDKHAGKPQLAEIDYLLHSADDRAGALGFGLNAEPPAPRRDFNQTVALEKLQRIADALIADEELAPDAANQQIQDLLLVGTSMGGARPKAVVEGEGALWIAKFNRQDDRWNSARVEHAMLTLARSCGLEAADSKVVLAGRRDVLMVRRFDRDRVAAGYTRARMISALTLLRTEDSHRARDRWSYVLLAEELRRVSAEPARDARELFRRMAFNALISNADDHPRNHAMIAKARDWRLSPAYDLTPSTPISLERRDLALVIGDAGRIATAENLISQSPRFLLKPDEAAAIIADMEQRVASTWYDVARSAGVNAPDCELISGAFVYPGFRPEPPPP
ncbi:MAG: HipA domain-containing protein [Phenylobacterium sp.]|nr:HipA domain-containing protein [Phenylobacterium sp.]